MNYQAYSYTDFDIAQIYKGDDFVVSDGIVIHQPTIREIIDFGESNFWHTIFLFTCNPTSMRVALWDAGQDWNKMDDFVLFISLVSNMKPEKTSILFGDLDFSQFDVLEDENEDYMLINRDNPLIQIDRKIYEKLVSYLRMVFNSNPKVEKIKGKFSKQLVIDGEKADMEAKAQLEGNTLWKNSTLFPLLSAVTNHAGFQYNLQEVQELTFFQFMDAVKRIRVIDTSNALLGGIYSGMLDTSKMKNLDKELDWTRDLYEVMPASIKEEDKPKDK